MVTASVGTVVSERGDDERDDAHLSGVEVGAGCTEIWEYLSEQREQRRRADAEDCGDGAAEE
jgi:hypothetical protein